jgi:hypothetical protein
MTICWKCQSDCLKNVIPLNNETSMSPLDVVRTHNWAASRVDWSEIFPPKNLTVFTGTNKYSNTEIPGKIQVHKK